MNFGNINRFSRSTLRRNQTVTLYSQLRSVRSVEDVKDAYIKALSAATKLPPATPRKTHFVAVSAVSRHTLRQHRYQVGVHAHALGCCPGHQSGVQALGNARHKAARLATGTGFGYRVSTLCGNA